MTLPKATKLTTMAAKANPLSKPLTEVAAATGLRVEDGAAAGAAMAGFCPVGGAATRVPAVPEAGGAGGLGTPIFGGGGGGGVPVLGDGGAAVAADAGGAPVGSMGNFTVGEAVGFGGKLMRTVSFLGWTLAASAGRGGSAPPGALGVISAIASCGVKLKLGGMGVKLYSALAE